MNKAAIMSFLFHDLKYHGIIGFYLQRFLYLGLNKYLRRGGAKTSIDRRFKKTFGNSVNWDNPQTLNEKLQWLKVNGFKDFHTVCADKYRMRNYLDSKFGNSDHQIPVLYTTERWQDITLDINKLRIDCHWAMLRNLYLESWEPQYKNIKPMIIIERLLTDKDGHIPNDYKLHYFNGELKFVYCSIGRETINKRNIYDSQWNPLYFTWSEKFKDSSNLRGPEIEAPASFELMKALGSEIAKDFTYVRVDFYDVDGYPYFGEITIHHGSGFDVFNPSHYDKDYGKQLVLSNQKRV